MTDVAPADDAKSDPSLAKPVQIERVYRYQIAYTVRGVPRGGRAEPVIRGADAASVFSDAEFQTDDEQVAREAWAHLTALERLNDLDIRVRNVSRWLPIVQATSAEVPPWAMP